ncbi:MAG: hypothetical protein JOS17DRAFT_776003 [Linnemannia elongata]|nr:MAG: hypothetical protein JOS17DRAFT_776003 [Linnemannia elongata]
MNWRKVAKLVTGALLALSVVSTTVVIVGALGFSPGVIVVGTAAAGIMASYGGSVTAGSLQLHSPSNLLGLRPPCALVPALEALWLLSLREMTLYQTEVRFFESLHLCTGPSSTPCSRYLL